MGAPEGSEIRSYMGPAVGVTLLCFPLTGAVALVYAARVKERAEAGDLDGAPEGFFPLLLEHTRQGMFCDPIHGGNRNFAGWDLLGYPGIKLVWTEADQSEGTEVRPEHVSVEEFKEGAA